MDVFRKRRTDILWDYGRRYLMSRPISRTLLTHSAVLRKYSLSTSWDEPVLEESIALEYIRIEPMFEAVMTADEERPRLSGRMFFDCVNSLPTGLGFDLSLHRYTVEF